MASTVRVGKIVRTEFIRERLGDEEYDRWVIKVFGGMLMPTRVPTETLQKTLDIVEGRANGHAAHLIPLAFRAWFAEEPKARKQFVTFLNARIAEDAANGNGHRAAEPVGQVAIHHQQVEKPKRRMIARRKRK